MLRRTPLKRGKKGIKRGSKLRAFNKERRERRRNKYRAFMRSLAWKEQRARVIERDGGECTRCKSRRSLQVHHKRYGSPIEATPDEWLVTLCYACHQRVESELRPWNRGRG